MITVGTSIQRRQLRVSIAIHGWSSLQVLTCEYTRCRARLTRRATAARDACALSARHRWKVRLETRPPASLALRPSNLSAASATVITGTQPLTHPVTNSKDRDMHNSATADAAAQRRSAGVVEALGGLWARIPRPSYSERISTSPLRDCVAFRARRGGW